MPCAFCGQPIHYRGAFCTDCLSNLVRLREAEESNPQSPPPRSLRPTLKIGTCKLCRQTPCACLCNICRQKHADCDCTAQAILEHYGIFSGKPPSERLPKASGM